MLTLPSSVKLYLATQPTDLRKSFGGLSALVEGTFGLSAMSGDLFIFLNRRGTQVRILFWDRDGFCVLMKKLEAGTFRRVKSAEGVAQVQIDAGELAMLLEGIDAPKVRRRKRYRQPQSAGPTSEIAGSADR